MFAQGNTTRTMMSAPHTPSMPTTRRGAAASSPDDSRSMSLSSNTYCDACTTQLSRVNSTPMRGSRYGPGCESACPSAKLTAETKNIAKVLIAIPHHIHGLRVSRSTSALIAAVTIITLQRISW
jgi:hypothetical protein